MGRGPSRPAQVLYSDLDYQGIHYRRLYSSCLHVPFAYILLEDKSTASYLRALPLLSTAAPLLSPDTVMVDFETTIYGLAFMIYPVDIYRAWGLLRAESPAVHSSKDQDSREV